MNTLISHKQALYVTTLLYCSDNVVTTCLWIYIVRPLIWNFVVSSEVVKKKPPFSFFVPYLQKYIICFRKLLMA